MFQFPSNGKVYSERSRNPPLPCRHKKVSIPFKRESVFRDEVSPSSIFDGWWFITPVSIPFKRESVFRVRLGLVDQSTHRFQFPSNGKVYSESPHPKLHILGSPVRFNSLQTGKCIQRISLGMTDELISGFNSLQTGKCIQRLNRIALYEVGHGEFQFPSNGKVYSEFFFVVCKVHYLQTMFQFPSNGKVYSEITTPIPKRRKQDVSIPFKRESVFRAGNTSWQKVVNFLFQFPSNGKVYSEWSQNFV